LKLEGAVQAAELSQSRAEHQLETTKEKLRLEKERTKEAADETQKLRVASLEASTTHRNEVEQLKKQLTRIDNSLQQTIKDSGHFKEVTQSDELQLRAKAFLLK
jgi:hypothetical protein